jgi:hypothetical protein
VEVEKQVALSHVPYRALVWIVATRASAGIEADLVDGGLATRGSGILVLRPGVKAAAAPPAASAGMGTRQPVSGTESAQSAAGFGFVLEGPLCEEYFAVRSVLYGLYTTV